MTEQELIELWGDGTQFGMTELGAGVMTGALNNAFREVAVKFALVVADKAYGIGYDIGAGDELFAEIELGLGGLVAGACALLQAIAAFLEAGHIGEHELGIDDLLIS